MNDTRIKPRMTSWPAWAAMACLFAALGCETTVPWQQRSDDGQSLSNPPAQGLVASESPKIADVPMPVGFVAVPSRSNSFVPPSGPRLVTHTYQGIATVTDAVNFYRRNVPTQGWQYVRERSDGSITTLVYVKGQEELTIQISHPRVLDAVVQIRDRNANGAAVIKP